jgi:hypothetical protein
MAFNFLLILVINTQCTVMKILKRFTYVIEYLYSFLLNGIDRIKNAIP